MCLVLRAERLSPKGGAFLEEQEFQALELVDFLSLRAQTQKLESARIKKRSCDCFCMQIVI
jgi:hypothetical protein